MALVRRREDLIVEVASKPVASVEDLQRVMVAELIGTKVPVRLLRQGREMELELVPGELE